MEKSEGSNSHAAKNVDRMKRQIQFESDSDPNRIVYQALKDSFIHLAILIFWFLSLGLGAWTFINREEIHTKMVKFDKQMEK